MFVHGDKVCFIVNFKTGVGKLFIKGMEGYTGSYLTSWIVSSCGISFNFPPCIVQEILNQLPSKDTLVDSNTGISFQY